MEVFQNVNCKISMLRYLSLDTGKSELLVTNAPYLNHSEFINADPELYIYAAVRRTLLNLGILFRASWNNKAKASRKRGRST